MRALAYIHTSSLRPRPRPSTLPHFETIKAGNYGTDSEGTLDRNSGCLRTCSSPGRGSVTDPSSPAAAVWCARPDASQLPTGVNSVGTTPPYDPPLALEGSCSVKPAAERSLKLLTPPPSNRPQDNECQPGPKAAALAPIKALIF
ncbi:hypothetical protein NL676_035043 [Syzygium grande]|nr:hypothetical protein NL676_035043 [Syzygium grande]